MTYRSAVDPAAGGGFAVPPGLAAELEAARRLITPGMRAAVDRLSAPMRRVAGFHFGWCDEHGDAQSAPAGKAVRPALVSLCSRAVGGSTGVAAGAAIAVELVHNFSLLHDDVMDADRTRRHRPTAWSMFGVPAAILAGDALVVLAGDVLATDYPPAVSSIAVRRLSAAVVRLIDGQTADMAFETRDDVTVAECLTMAAGKTGALMACSCELGALAAGAAPERVGALREFGEHLGLAFQLVDDLLGIWGEPSLTGKPVMSDLRTRKKSLPVVAALNAGTAPGNRLRELYRRPEPLSADELEQAADLVEQAGGRDWARRRADEELDAALGCLRAADPVGEAADHLESLAQMVADRDN